MKLRLSDEQKTIIDSNDREMSVIAFAGAAKSTTIKFKAKSRNSAKKLYLCFNKSVASEGIKSFNEFGVENINITTIHSLAYNSQKIGNYYKLVNNIKVHELIQQMGEKLTPSNYMLYNQGLKLFSSYCNSSSRKIEDVNYFQKVIDSNPPDDILEMIKKKSSKIQKIAQNIWISMDNAKIPITHDFYLKKYQLKSPKLNYDIIYLDEGQDSSPVMLDIFMNQKSEKVVVGDPHQSLYGWRDAVNALDVLPYTRYYLTQSFRFPNNIAKIANDILNVKKIYGAADKDFNIKGLDKPSGRVGKIAYIGRNNMSILSRAILMAEANDIKFAYEGSLDNTIYTQNGVSIYDIYYLFANKKDKIRHDFIKMFKGWGEFVKHITDMEDFELKTLAGLILKYKNDVFPLIKKLKTNERKKNESDIIFSTAHKSKGLEYSKVYVLDDFISKKLFTESLKLMNKLSHDQRIMQVNKISEELNVLYVAVTRTLNELYISGDIPAYSYFSKDELFQFSKMVGK
jgi:superfamily I DNA/RNA helicase